MRMLFPAVVAALAFACGGDDSGSAVGDSCRAVCDKQGQATGCTNLSSYIMSCKALCAAIIPALDDDCREKAGAAYDCQAQLSYMCFEGGNFPVQTTEACAAELQAYSSCLPRNE